MKPVRLKAQLQPAILWLLFFSIALGLGYPTLNRYDPAATPGVVDARIYAQMTREGPEGIGAPWRYRMAAPLVVRPLYQAVDGRLGSWDAMWFAFLLVNSAVIATAATLLLGLGLRMTGDPIVGIVAVLLLLVNFTLPNFHLAGLIDSFELLAMIMAIIAMFDSRWYLLPFIAAAGTVVKESVLPMTIAFAVGWWFFREGRERSSLKVLGWIVISGGAATAALALDQSLVDGALVLPWSIRVGQHPTTSFLDGLLTSTASNNMLYTFGWLLPLAAFRLRRFPIEFVGGTAAAVVVILFIGAWATIEGNVARPIFNVAAPLLVLASALMLLDLVRPDRSPQTEF